MNKDRFKRLSVFLECSTESTPTVETVKNYIRLISQFGYNELYLGLTEAYKIEGEPYFNYMRGGYTIEQLQDMDACAKQYGVELIANIQVLCHLPYLAKYACYSDMFDTDQVLLVDDERVYALVEKMIDTMSKGLSSRRIHIGMDEGGGIGQGNYKTIHKKDVDGGELLLRHLNRVYDMAQKYGYTVEMWGDMLTMNKKSNLTAQEIKARIPNDVETIYWWYGPATEEDLTCRLNDFLSTATDVGYAGCAYKMCGFGPNNYLISNTLFPQMDICEKMGIDHFMVTLWSDHGGLCSVYSILPALFTAAEYARGEIKDASQTNKKRFEEITGISYDAMYSLDLLNNPFNKKLENDNSRSYWILLDDPFVGNKCTMLSEGTDEKYAEIERYYASIDGGFYAPIFRMAQALCGMLKIKCILGRDIRSAYDKGDKEALKKVIDTEIAPLKKKLDDFADIYRKYWDHDNMAFGVEAAMTAMGALSMRYNYLTARINEYIETGRKIEELENKLLPAGTLRATEDEYSETRFPWLLSYCEIT